MDTRVFTPPANPDIKRELKKHLLALPARSFEFFAGDLLVYIGLEAVSVTRYIGDAEVRTLLVGTSEARGVYAFGGSPSAFHLRPGTHRQRHRLDNR